MSAFHDLATTPVAAAMAAYRHACTTAGGDPDIELLTARVEHAVPATMWAAWQLLHTARGGARVEPGPVSRAGLLDLANSTTVAGVRTHVAWLLAASPDRSIPIQLAQWSWTPAPVLAALVHRDDLDSDAALAANRATPTEALAVLAARLSGPFQSAICELLAGHPNTDLTIVRTLLAATDDEWVIATIAARGDLPLAMSIGFAGHSSRVVRLAALRNPALPAPVLASLADDRDATVRKAVAEHANATAGTLYGLARDPDATVAAAAMARNPGRRRR